MLDGTLRLVFWETTAGCNLACVHCRRTETGHALSASDLSTSEGRRLIDEIAEAGRPVLVFSGGEPLLRPDLFELAGHAKQTRLPIALATNGTLIDPNMADRIAAAGFDRVSISLDGADPLTHDRFRGQVGSFEQATRALAHLRSAGVATQINCTIARHNQDQLADVLQLGERMGVAAAHYFLLVPVGCGEQIAADQMLGADEVEDRLRELCELEQRTALQIKATCAPHYYRIRRQRHKGGRPLTVEDSPLHRVTKGCLAGTAVCFVAHDGKVFPCGYLPVVAGDVRERRFADIWRENSLFAALRDPTKLTGKCGVCEFQAVCGGCRARAFQRFGDWLAEEPCCRHVPTPRESG